MLRCLTALISDIHSSAFLGVCMFCVSYSETEMRKLRSYNVGEIGFSDGNWIELCADQM